MVLSERSESKGLLYFAFDSAKGLAHDPERTQ